jgi:hypothetical protein
MPRTGAFASTTDEVWQADLDLKLFARFAWHGSHGRKWSSSVGEGFVNVLNIGTKAPKAACVRYGFDEGTCWRRSGAWHSGQLSACRTD